MEEIKKLEDMPKYVPIILIQDKGTKDSKPRLFGNNPHDNLVLKHNKTQLYYYNSQCASSSLDIDDFRFVNNGEPACCLDDFYSRWCEMVDLEKLIEEHDKQVRKEVVQEIKKQLDVDPSIAEDYFKVLEILDQIQGEK